MKKILFLALFSATLLFGTNVGMNAQQDDYVQNILKRVAYVNSEEVLDMMPEKIQATELINTLNGNYRDELQVMQNEYNKKYSDFITYQNTMAENVRLRRMQELQELERRIEEFMQVAQDDIKIQEKELIEPLKEKIKEAIETVGTEGGYIAVYDMANKSILFVTPFATNITSIVKARLRIE